jgi:long-chain fatty acid transport protein
MSMSTLKAGLLIAAGAVVILFAVATAHGAGFALAEQSATAGGTGAAGAAREGDAGLAWYNPAGLADGRGWRSGAGLLLARPVLEAKAMDGSWASENEAAWATPPNLSLTYAHGAWAAGVWVGVPFGSGVSWPADWPGRHEITRSQLTVFRVAPFAAWAFGDGRLRVSVGAHVDAGRLEVARKLDFIDVDGDVHIDMDGVGVGFDAALWWRAHDEVDVGLVYKSRTSIDLEGGADFETPDAFTEKTADQMARTTLTLPDRIVVGGRWHRGAWAAVADVEVTLWGVNDTLVIDFERDQTPDVHQVNDWSATVALRGGVEWNRRKLTLRGGAYFDPSPAPDDTLAPSSPDSSRAGVTVGAGWQLSRTVAVDAFYEHMRLLGRSSSGDEALAATYGGTAHMIGLGVRW